MAGEAPVCDESQIVSPVGDFIAMVAGFTAFLFPLVLNWYSLEGSAKVGIKTIVGIISFMVGVAVFVCAIVILVLRFKDPCYRTSRSPGWLYGAGAAVIFMTSILGLVVTPSMGGVSYGISIGIILEIFAAAGIAVGGLFKF